MRGKCSSPSARLYFHTPVSRTKLSWAARTAPEAAAMHTHHQCPKASQNLFIIPMSQPLPALVPSWCCQSLHFWMVQVEGQLVSPQPSPGAALQSTKHPPAARMSALEGALGIKDVRILSVHEPKIHSPELLKESCCQARALTKKSVIIQNSLWDGE